MAEPPRKLGRPPLDPANPTVQVTLRVPAPTYDAIYRRSSRDRCSMSEAIRRQLTARDDGEDD
jgi:hypothetical protein